MKYILLSMALLSGLTHAAAGDTGVISELYVDNTGAVAIKLKEGFTNSVNGEECTTSNGWAGVTIDAPELKSALLAAKATNSTVTVIIDGCAANGAWFKLRAAYVK
jgi:hypothetical protein